MASKATVLPLDDLGLAGSFYLGHFVVVAVVLARRTYSVRLASLLASPRTARK